MLGVRVKVYFSFMKVETLKPNLEALALPVIQTFICNAAVVR